MMNKPTCKSRMALAFTLLSVSFIAQSGICELHKFDGGKDYIFDDGSCVNGEKYETKEGATERIKKKEKAVNKLKSQCNSTADIYQILIEEMGNRIMVNPDSISLNRVEYVAQFDGALLRPGNSCWGTFYTPRGAASCELFFDNKNIIIRIDCTKPIGQLCVGSCDVSRYK